MEEKQIKHWLKENWFRSVIALGVIIISASAFYYFVILSQQKEARIAEQSRLDLIEKNNKEAQAQEQAEIDLLQKNKLEAQKATKEALAKQQKENRDRFVNKCVTDAYTELKTLQWNTDVSRSMFCSAHPDCNLIPDDTDKNKAEAFRVYQEEWVPQCKLGNRVFLDYEPYSY